MSTVSSPGRPPRGAGLPSESLYLDIVGASPAMQRILRLVARVAPTDSTVLLSGETGTGKELVARSLHVQSKRSRGPFVPVNVSAIPDTLVESELFGTRRGAYTGATADRAGLIEQADGGTLFLDEIGEMPLTTQAKLLRFLESHEVRRLGDGVTRLVNSRLVAATHRDLRALVAAERFREDLYYRLNVVRIELPPLRERRGDIGLLASYFLARIAARQGRDGIAFSPEAMDALERFDYPGNVRQLENAIEHAVTLCEGAVIRPRDLPAELRMPRMLPRHVPNEVGASRSAEVDRDRWSLAEVEKEHIRRVLEIHRGNATSAARQLGISRTTLWRKLREYGLSRNREGS